jgi:hypothetical protein
MRYLTPDEQQRDAERRRASRVRASSADNQRGEPMAEEGRRRAEEQRHA